MKTATIQPAAPCVACGTVWGTTRVWSRRPERISLRRFGVEGVACNSCYAAARYRAKVGRDVLTGERN